jgi:LysM repeat protein
MRMTGRLLRLASLAGALASIAVLVGGGMAGTSARQVKVRPGETLSQIASREHVSVAALAGANGITNLNHVEAGRVLTVPGGGSSGGGSAPAASGSYTVKPGDTLASIASRHGTSVSAIVRANSIKNPNVVVIGTRLAIPAGGGSSSSGGSGGGSGSGLPAKLLAHPERLALAPAFDRWAGRNGIPSDLLKALCWIESGWQTGVVSSTGAVGVGQLMPSAVTHMRSVIGVPTLNPWVPEDNIRMSARLLHTLLDQSGGDVRTAVASYYQGPRSVREIGLLPETKSYVEAVLAFRPRFR